MNKKNIQLLLVVVIQFTQKFRLFSYCNWFSKKLLREILQLNDDIYVTGNIGDSYLGLKFIKKQKSFSKKLEKYFINKYYCPDIPYNFSKKLSIFANTSIDISDGLISDMERLINNQRLSFELNVNKIPISSMLKSYLNKNNIMKEKFVFNGDDYQILFTSSKKPQAN